jgi:pyridoxal phosphate enzyme (YggS family)
MTLQARIARVQDAIAAACASAQRSLDAVTLVAVSKTHPAQTVLEAVAAGMRHFGENRVEEASDKIPAVNAASDAELVWHMIGHIQSRKAKDVIPLFQKIHSVDSPRLAARLSAAAEREGRILDVLLEINISGEANKYGIAAAGWDREPAVREGVWQAVSAIAALPGLHVRGLMTMAPIVEQAEQARPVFAGLAALRDELAGTLQLMLPDLSMGMTDDYPVAVQEGATIVRVGRAIFGERQ